jgi:hypothetical protein
MQNPLYKIDLSPSAQICNTSQGHLSIRFIECIHICDAWLPPGMPHCADDAENARADAGEFDGATSGEPEGFG